jgi:DNA-binding FadR family transcriptional regulator
MQTTDQFCGFVRDRDFEAARLAMLQHLSEVAELTREHHPSF